MEGEVCTMEERLEEPPPLGGAPSGGRLPREPLRFGRRTPYVRFAALLLACGWQVQGVSFSFFSFCLQ